MLLLGLAVAAPRVDPPRVDPGVEPSDVQAEYRAWAAGEKRTGDRAELVCRAFAESVSLCFTRIEGSKRVYFTKADGGEVAALEASGRGEPSNLGLEPVTVEGFTGRYWLRAEGDGRDHVPALHPDALRALVGGEVLAAFPARGVFVAWAPGDTEFDKVVAVGVRRMYETLENPVSPLVYRLSGGAWDTWGEARATEPVPLRGAPR